MKKINFPFKKHFIDRLYLYVIAIILIPAIVSYGVILKTNPKDYEIFSVFVEANFRDSSSFKNYIKENTGKANKEINLYSITSDLKAYEVVYQTQGLESDILILSDKAFKNDYSSNYVELMENSSFYSDTNKMVNDKHFGIQIFDGMQGKLTDFINYEENQQYYLFINKYSVHTSRFVNEGKTEQIFKLLGVIYG